LIDDFIGSGTTLLRKEEDKWKGKLPRFWADIAEVLGTHFDADWVLASITTWRLRRQPPQSRSDTG